MKQDLTIPQGALDGIEAFLRVAERRSFSAAAADLGVSPSAISQTIKALEARVGAPLFMRTTRSVGLTQAGEMFLERAAPAYSGLADAYEAARNLGNRPAGRLRINLMRGAVQPLFEPIIAGFCETYPEIELEIYADDALSDLSAGGFDAGVRMGESLDADVVAVRLTGPFRFVVAGARLDIPCDPTRPRRHEARCGWLDSSCREVRRRRSTAVADRMTALYSSDSGLAPEGAVIWSVAAFGGDAGTLIPGAARAVWSPDGARLAFERR